ncbi:hypothetical protein [Streptomyces sp. NBC_00385]|uniref:hypothetical protein n=1 Tax=Streptomyces sp. NBC_00385 TaxID=2975733 RepID=UPI002DD8DD27|nr:hypothetical protein [Streptomyces sp. NBC_00385]WRZ06331.1 hypothetical protein OG959_24830 [Streptomyces sp. NBC_00385]
MWPRVNGMRALELGHPGEMRAALNALVLAGRKTATTCLLAEYAEETEGLEYVGERQALLDSEGRSIATLSSCTLHAAADLPLRVDGDQLGPSTTRRSQVYAVHRVCWCERKCSDPRSLRRHDACV